MTTTTTTPIRIDEHGQEAHESWISMRANNATSGRGVRLFGSDIRHTHFVIVTVSRVTRRRELHHDWHHETTRLFEAYMSFAQWGAFVSSFGNGDAKPATLNYLFPDGDIPTEAHTATRTEATMDETAVAAKKAAADIAAAAARLRSTFDNRGTRTAIGDALHSLECAIRNLPANLAFAEQMLTEHVENVVTKARGDIEAMVNAHAAAIGIPVGDLTPAALTITTEVAS